jgi:uncharacterized protein involved in tolerance to divalent cations
MTDNELQDLTLSSVFIQNKIDKFHPFTVPESLRVEMGKSADGYNLKYVSGWDAL